MALEGSIIHTLMGIGFAGVGWIFKTQWDSLRELDDKVDVLQIRVADEYVKRDELREEFKRLFAKLDTIEHKLDQKADK